ncbi:MAG: tyrosine-type recombinase/integrase [Elusimicrobiota bacterium]|jgi:integrase/recombinase XerD|nr:tyrosine-type recombinase/integrase [Elusimicrobiota bacterium]
MAYLTLKNGRYYIRDYHKAPKLNQKGLPAKDKDGNIIYENINKWIKSSKIKKLAEIELGKYEEDKDRGRIGLDKKAVSWNDIKSRYMAYSRANKAPTSVMLDKEVFAHLEEFYPALSYISDINISLCEKFFDWLKNDKHNAEATVKRKGTTIKNLGSKLVDWEIVKYNPLQKLKIPKVNNEKEIKFWRAPEEMNRVIEKATGIWKTINMIGFCIGARLAEILNLSWDSFDFDNDTYKIQSEGHFRTKSRKFRTGKLPPVLKQYLLKLKKEQAKNPNIKPNSKIVIYTDGSIPTVHSASSYLRKFYKSCGFKGYHAHCLRHTFAAHFLYKYRDIYGLSKLLGHHSVEITSKYYGHFLGNYFDSSMAKFNPFEP